MEIFNDYRTARLDTAGEYSWQVKQKGFKLMSDVWLPRHVTPPLAQHTVGLLGGDCECQQTTAQVEKDFKIFGVTRESERSNMGGYAFCGSPEVSSKNQIRRDCSLI